jgi:hypothetical protein
MIQNNASENRPLLLLFHQKMTLYSHERFCPWSKSGTTPLTPLTTLQLIQAPAAPTTKDDKFKENIQEEILSSIYVIIIIGLMFTFL